MTDRPIIFSAPMVRALLDGRKTMTRRKVGPPWALPTQGVAECWIAQTFPGDRLWVREAWAMAGDAAGLAVRELTSADGVSMNRFYRGLLRHRAGSDAYDESTQAWRPSIHMPRWASRLTLTVTAVKIERLQDISEADAEAEGVACPQFRAAFAQKIGPESYHIPVSWRGGFANLWSGIYGPGSWEANPEVVAIGFTVDRRNIDAGVET